MGKRHGDTIFFLAVFLALTGLFFALPPLGLQSNAEGTRYVQMKNFHLNGSLAIPDPGEALGFGAADFVQSRFFFETREGALRTIIPPVFSWLSGFFYPLLGERVVHFLPLLSLFFALIFMARTLGQVMDRGPFYFILLGIFIVSPILWRIFGFTEHTGAVFLLTGGGDFLTRYFSKANSPADLFLAFLLTGVSVFLVPGFVIALAALTLSCAIVLARERKGRDLALVFLGGLLPVLARALHEQMLYGSAPGLYLAMELRQFALPPALIPVLVVVLCVPGIFVAVAGRAALRPAVKSGFYFMATLALLGGMAVLSSRIELSDLLAFFPLVFLVFYGIGERLDHWLAAGEGTLGLVLTMTVFFCLAGGAIVMPGGAGPAGVLLLPVVPCVVLLVGLERETIFRYRGMYLILAFLVLIGVVNGYEPAKDSYRASLYNAERVAFIRSNTADGDVVVFGDRGSMEHAGPLFFDRVFLIAGREEGMRTILGKLRDRGIHLCHLWTMDRSLVFRFGNPYGEDRRDVFPPPGWSGRSPGFSLIRLDVGRAIEALEKGRHNGRTR